MKLNKLILLIVVCLFPLIITAQASAEQNVSIIMNGQKVYPDVPPQIIDGRTMVPLRFISELFGAEISWDNNTQTVYINYKAPINSYDKPTGGPVVPNESFVTAEVLGFSVMSSSLLDMQPKQTLYSLDLLILESESIDGMANFIKSGDVIKVYSNTLLSQEIYTKKIQANVIYQGDERKAMYWINKIITL